MRYNYFKIFFLFYFGIAVHTQAADLHKAHIVYGKGVFQYGANSLEFKAFQDKTILEWDHFSLKSHEAAHFALPTSRSMILNRITGFLPSMLEGKLTSNGRLFIINPNGIIIGENCLIQASHFVASTLDVFDKDFIEKEEVNFLAHSQNSVVNFGNIEALDGDVILCAYHVENYGKIQASGTAALAAGESILLKPKGKEKIWIERKKTSKISKKTGIVNQGELSALFAEVKADGNLYAQAIQDSSKIDATCIKNDKGRIFLVAYDGKESISGTYKAPGGEIHCLANEIVFDKAYLSTSSDRGGGNICVGLIPENKMFYSDKIIFDKESQVVADAFIEGNGGRITFAANNHLSILGAISCHGGKEGGNGGCIEVSSKNELVYLPKYCDRSAINGSFGKLIYDPVNIIIDHFSTNSNPLIQPQYPPSKNYAGAAILNVSDLVGQNGLAMGDVEIRTATFTENPFEGNIYVNQPISWKQNTTLTLKASHDIYINAPIENMGNSKSSFLILETEHGREGSIFIHGALSTNASPEKEGQFTLSAWADKSIEITEPIKLFGSPVFFEAANTFFHTDKGSITLHALLETHGKPELLNDVVMFAKKNIELGGKNDAKILSHNGKVFLQADENIFIHAGSSTKEKPCNSAIVAKETNLKTLLGDVSIKGGVGKGSSYAGIESEKIILQAPMGDVEIASGSSWNGSSFLQGFSLVDILCKKNLLVSASKMGASVHDAYICTSGSKNGHIKIQAQKIELLAGGAGQACAYIGHENDQGQSEIFASEGIFLLGGCSKEPNIAKIYHNGGGDLVVKTPKILSLLGGDFLESDALISFQKQKGNLTLEAGEIILKAHKGKATVSHMAEGGDLVVHSLQDGIKIFGGKEFQAHAGVVHDGAGDLKILSDHGPIELLAGSGHSFIEKKNGTPKNPHHLTLVIDSKEAPISLRGSQKEGDHMGSYILFEKSFGSCSISSCGLELTSGNSPAQILTKKITGDLLIDLKDGNDLTVISTESPAEIAMQSSEGDIKLEHIHDIRLQGGFGEKSSSSIRVDESRGDIFCTQIGGNITLSGGSGKSSEAIIENCGHGNIFLGSKDNPLTGNFILKAGNAYAGNGSCRVSTSNAGDILAYIHGDYLLSGSSIEKGGTAEISSKGGNIVLNGRKLEVFSYNDDAKITLENSALDIELTDSMILEGSQNHKSRIAILGKGKNHLTCLIGNHLIMRGYSEIFQESESGKITLVVDHNYPIYPHVGQGGVVTSKESKITSLTPISMFIGHPDHSDFLGDVNETTPYFPPYSFEGHYYDTYYPKEFSTPGLKVAFYYKIPEPGLAPEGILSYGLFLSASVSSEIFMRLNDVEKNRVFYANYYAKIIDQYESFSIQNDLTEDMMFTPTHPMTKIWAHAHPYFLKNIHKVQKK